MVRYSNRFPIAQPSITTSNTKGTRAFVPHLKEFCAAHRRKAKGKLMRARTQGYTRSISVRTFCAQMPLSSWSSRSKRSPSKRPFAGFGAGIENLLPRRLTLWFLRRWSCVAPVFALTEHETRSRLALPQTGQKSLPISVHVLKHAAQRRIHCLTRRTAMPSRDRSGRPTCGRLSFRPVFEEAG